MIDFKLDPISRDMVFPSGPNGASLSFLDGAERVTQSVAIRLRTWLGEWFLDAEHGVPYVDDILGKGRRPELIEAILRAQILSVAGVRSIESFELSTDPHTRKLTVTFSATSDEGLVTATVGLS